MDNKIDNKQIRDEVNISFVGLDADDGIISVEDLIKSLEGDFLCQRAQSRN